MAPSSMRRVQAEQQLERQLTPLWEREEMMIGWAVGARTPDYDLVIHLALTPQVSPPPRPKSRHHPFSRFTDD